MALTTETFASIDHPFQTDMDLFSERLLTRGMSGVSDSFSLKSGASFSLKDFVVKSLGSSAADYLKVVGTNEAGEVVYSDILRVPDETDVVVTVNSVVKAITLIPVTIQGGTTFEGAGNLQFWIDNIRYDLTLPDNVAPQITGAGTNPFPYDETGGVYPFESPAVTILDADGDELTVTVKADQPGLGTLFSMPTPSGKQFVDVNGVLTFTGSAADATAALRNVSLTFVDVDSVVDTGQSTNLTFTITVDDGHGNQVVNTSALSTVRAVNEAPSVTAIGNVSHQVVGSGNAITPFAKITIDDPDNKPVTAQDIAPDGLQVRITFANADGTLAGDGWTKVSGGAATAEYVFSGTFQEATDSIRALVFTPTPLVGVQKVTTNFGISVTDGVFTSSFAGEVSVDVIANQAPIATDDSFTVAEGGTATRLDGNVASVLENDTDADNQTLNAQVVQAPTRGTLVLNANGTFSYVHDGSENDTDFFAYKANDGVTDSNIVFVNITVTPVDDAPTASSDSFIVAEDSGATTFDVLANELDVDDGPRSVSGVTQPAFGTVVLSDDGVISYEPNANWNGIDVFTYTLVGGSSAAVMVTVLPVDDAPTAVDDSVLVLEDSSATLIDVLANDQDIDGGPISVSSVTQGQYGTVAVAGAGTGLTYIPDANFNGTDSFTYKLNGGSSATVVVTVTGTQDAPVITSNGGGASASVDIAENQTQILTVSGADIDGDVLTYGIATGNAATNADSALFSINATTGVLSFTAARDFENPGDANRDNVYLVGVTATDGSSTATQWLSIKVTDVAESSGGGGGGGGGGAVDGPSGGQGPVGATVFTSTAADEKFDGSSGLDYVVYSGSSSQYKIVLGPNGLPASITGPGGADTFVNVDRLKFSDGILAYDAAPKQGYRLYEAAFNRDPDKAGLTWWVNQLDQGQKSLVDTAANFLYSEEFTRAFGDARTMPAKDLLGVFYKNILGRNGDDAGLNYWLGQLENGLSRHHMLAHFSESQENQQGVAAEIVGGVMLDNSLFTPS